MKRKNKIKTKQEQKRQSKKITALFITISLIAGLFFLSNGITGNIVITEEKLLKTSFSLIGILLVLCAVAAFFYLFKKRID